MDLQSFNLTTREFIKNEVFKVYETGNTIRFEAKVTISIEEVYYWVEITGVTYAIYKLDGTSIGSGSMTYEDNGIYYYNFDTTSLDPGIYKVVITAINGAQQVVRTISRAFQLRELLAITTTSTSTTTTTTTP